MIVPLLLALLAQDVDPLVDRLRAEKIEDREAATRKLRELGKAALPALRKVLQDPDQEVVERARYLIDYILVQADAPVNLKREFPDLAERLSVIGAVGWREVFLEALDENDGKRAHPLLEKADLEYLGAGAIRGCRTAAEKVSVCRYAAWNGLDAAIESYLPLLEDKDSEVRQIFLFALGQVGVAGKTAVVARLLKDPEPEVAAAALDALVRFAFLGTAEPAGEFLGLLSEDRAALRTLGCKGLGKCAVASAATELTKRLGDPDEDVRIAAAAALCRVGVADGVPILLLAAEKERYSDLWVLNALREPETWKALREEKRTGAYSIPQKPIPEILAEFTSLRITTSTYAANALNGPGAGIAMRIFPHKARSTLDLVQPAVSRGTLGQRFEFVLDRTEIRILRDFEAQKFWKAWWDSRPKK